MNKTTLFCEGEGCPFKYDCKCYLPREQSNSGSQYFIDVPYDLETNACVFRWPKNY